MPYGAEPPRDGNWPKRWGEKVMRAFSIGWALMIVGWVAATFIMPPVVQVASWLYMKTPEPWRPSAGAVCVLVIGRLLFLLKLEAQVVYGRLEIVVAFLSAMFVLKKDSVVPIGKPESLPVMITLATSVYVTVRGLGNIREGRQKKKEKQEKKAIEEEEKKTLKALLQS